MNNLKSNRRPVGFTLLEILLTMIIFAVLYMVSAGFFVSFINKSKLDTTKLLAAQGIRRAMMKSQAGDQQSAWGIYMTTGQIIIFKGATYNARDVAYDIVTTVDNGITFSGATEIDFPELTGELTSNRTVVLTAAGSGEARSITVGMKGALTY